MFFQEECNFPHISAPSGHRSLANLGVRLASPVRKEHEIHCTIFFFNVTMTHNYNRISGDQSGTKCANWIIVDNDDELWKGGGISQVSIHSFSAKITSGSPTTYTTWKRTTSHYAYQGSGSCYMSGPIHEYIFAGLMMTVTQYSLSKS